MEADQYFDELLARQQRLADIEATGIGDLDDYAILLDDTDTTTDDDDDDEDEESDLLEALMVLEDQKKLLKKSISTLNRAQKFPHLVLAMRQSYDDIAVFMERYDVQHST